MLDFRLTRSHPRAVALIDISSGSASVALCSIEGARARVVSTATSAPSLEVRDDKHASTLLLSQLREAGEKVRSGYTGPAPEAAYIISHAPLSSSRTFAAETQYERAVRIQDSVIAHMAREALAHELPDRSKLMEASVMRIELNGFPTMDPAGKWATHVRTVSLLSECDPDLKRAVESEVQKLFPAATLLWRSSARACVAFARLSGILEENYFILDVGATACEAISVRSGELASRTIPLGAAHILSKIASGKPTEEVLGALRMLESGAASGESADALQKRMALAEPEIVKVLADSIAQLAAGRRLSNTLLLIVSKDLEPWLTRMLSKIDFSQFTVTTLPFEVRTPSGIPAGMSAESGLLVDLALVNSEVSDDA